MSKPEYRISPSILNSFQSLIDSDAIWEEYWGGSDDPPMTAEEFAVKQEKDLIDSINRVKKEPIEAADKGTCLNYIVDEMVQRGCDNPKGVAVTRIFNDDDPREVIGLKAELNGFSFPFDIRLCTALASYFSGSVPQYRCEATLPTKYGDVILYGDADYIRKDIVYDLKTTKQYKYGKFAKGWQKDLYPYCLIEGGEMSFITEFEYTVVPLTGGTGGNLITGEIFRERYDYNHGASTLRLKGIVESFVMWLKQHRHLITHPRIFNQ